MLLEFQKTALWDKSKIIELQQRLGLKPSQIYKWNWDMQRKLGERQGPASQSVSAPDITVESEFRSGRKVSDWTGDLLDLAMCKRMGMGVRKGCRSNADEKEPEDCLMSDEQDQQLEVQS